MNRLMLIGLISSAVLGAAPALAQPLVVYDDPPKGHSVTPPLSAEKIQVAGMSTQQVTAVMRCKLDNTIITHSPQGVEEMVTNLSATEACVYKKTGIQMHSARDFNRMKEKYEPTGSR